MGTRCLVLACDNYVHWPQLKRAVRDAYLIKSALLQRGLREDDIEILKDFTREGENGIFPYAEKRFAKKMLPDPPFWIICVVLCHGYEQDGELFLRPSDSRRDDDDFCLSRFVRHLPANAGVLCFMGACREHRATVARPFSKSRLQKRLDESINQGPEEFFIFPCRSGYVIPDESCFASAVAEAICEIADQHDLHDLARCINDKVATKSRELRVEVVHKLRTARPRLSTAFGLKPPVTNDADLVTGEQSMRISLGDRLEELPIGVEGFKTVNSHQNQHLPHLVGQPRLDCSELPHPACEMQSTYLDDRSKARIWLPCLFLAATLIHFILLSLWTSGVARLQWSTRVSFNLMLSSLFWASLNQVSGDDWAQEQCHSIPNLVSVLSCKWNAVRQCAFERLLPLHFLWQAFGEWKLDGDGQGAIVTCGIACFWIALVKPFGPCLIDQWRGSTAPCTHRGVFPVWSWLFSAACASSAINALLLWLATDSALEWADKIFHVFQFMFVAVVYFTFAHDCELRFSTKFHTAAASAYFTVFALSSAIALMYCRVDEGAWESPVARNLALLSKYSLLCTWMVVLYHMPKKTTAC